jgi:hypothetical protein
VRILGHNWATQEYTVKVLKSGEKDAINFEDEE